MRRSHRRRYSSLRLPRCLIPSAFRPKKGRPRPGGNLDVGSILLDRTLSELNAAVHGLHHQLTSAAADAAFYLASAHTAFNGHGKVGMQLSVHGAEFHI